MAWWRERLEELDAGARVPAESRLGAVAAELLPRGVSGADLSRLEDAWLPLLEPFPWGADVAEGLRLRGRILFGIGARLLGCDAQDGEAAGVLWSLADAAFHCSDQESREFLWREAIGSSADVQPRLPTRIRPMTLLSALALHDIRFGQSQDFSKRLVRVSVALVHRFRGTLPHGR